MAGETEVKAEVRLRVKNVAGDRIVIGRKLQVTKKKATLSMKTLEGFITYADEQGDTNKVSLYQHSVVQDSRLLSHSEKLCPQDARTWIWRCPTILVSVKPSWRM